MFDLSIIIVYYKTPTLLHNCIESLYNTTKNINFEIIVIDNHSEDNGEKLIVSNFNRVIWINQNYNSGFARANNAAIKIAQGKYILFLNPDTIIVSGSIEKSFNFLVNNEQKLNIGVLGCMIRNKDSSIQFSASAKSISFRKVAMQNDIICYFMKLMHKETNYSSSEFFTNSQIVSWLGGAFMMFNSSNIKANNWYFDEDFFMYSEDAEICDRIRKSHNAYFYSGAEIVHLSGSSSNSDTSKQGQITISEWLYILKAKGKLYLFLYLGFEEINIIIFKLFKNHKSIEEIMQYNFKGFLIKAYFFKLLFKYSHKLSKSKNMLIFKNENPY